MLQRARHQRRAAGTKSRQRAGPSRRQGQAPAGGAGQRTWPQCRCSHFQLLDLPLPELQIRRLVQAWQRTILSGQRLLRLQRNCLEQRLQREQHCRHQNPKLLQRACAAANRRHRLQAGLAQLQAGEAGPASGAVRIPAVQRCREASPRAGCAGTETLRHGRSRLTSQPAHPAGHRQQGESISAAAHAP